jgi:hypothetical protein
MAKAKKARQPAATMSKDVCFVIMPFGGWLDDYYQDIYCPAIEAAGLEPHRADDLFTPSTIVNDIWQYTKRAKLVLADLSGKNPNVFYELGLAHALAKPAVLVAESMENVPFDLRALRVIVYDKNAPDWGTLLREKVTTAVKDVMKAPAESVLPAFLDTKGSASKTSVTPQEKELLEIRQQLDLLRSELRDPERSTRREIGAGDARELIRDYLARGMPQNMIIERLVRLGPPVSWIQEEIRRARIEQKKRPKR